MPFQALHTRKLAMLIVLSALCMAVQLTPRLPNVEFTSFFAFTVGLMQGAISGALFGCFVMFANGFLSPYGFAGLNMPFQIIGMALAGVLGGVYRWYMSARARRTSWARFCAEAAILGAFIALIYDLITNIGVGVSFILAGMNPALAIFSAIAYGAFFSIIHIFSNTVVFGVLTLPSVNALNNLIRSNKVG
jgi:hypothetical protein